MSLATILPPEATDAPPPEADLDSLYEIVAGRRVEKPPMGTYEGVVGSVLVEMLAPYARSNRLGRVVSEVLFRINKGDGPHRRPDVAFVSYERWPRERKINSNNGWDIVPDLAVEVVSPSNTAEEVFGKIREYFQAGVRRVWIVLPVERQVYVYESSTKTKILGLGDALDGEDLLPGFRLALAVLFEDGADA